MTMQREPQVQALKVTGHEAFVSRSLRDGIARMSWGYLGKNGGPVDGDLRRIKNTIDKQGWQALHPDDEGRFQQYLLELNEGDWIVYVNLPEWGMCMAARVTGTYHWDEANHDDCNHCLPVDPASVIEFDRNDARVHPAISARLRLQGRQWRIWYVADFLNSIAALSGTQQSVVTPRQGSSGAVAIPASSNGPTASVRKRAVGDGIGHWLKAIEEQLNGITQQLQHAHPNYDLEKLLEETFRRVPGVVEVERKGGRSDHGADLIVTSRSGLVAALERDDVCVVQVKSFRGTHDDPAAVKDIERAFDHYPEATQGLIVSTADVSGPNFDKALEELESKTDKPVGVMMGKDVGLFVLEAGLHRSLI